jgi:hypothetical protein
VLHRKPTTKALSRAITKDQLVSGSGKTAVRVGDKKTYKQGVIAAISCRHRIRDDASNCRISRIMEGQMEVRLRLRMTAARYRGGAPCAPSGHADFHRDGG